MSLRTIFFSGLAVAGLLVSTTAFAGYKGEIDYSDAASVLKGAKYWGFAASEGINKKTGIPSKVAIGTFQIQYSFRTQEFGSGSQVWISFSDEDYQAITDELYSVFVEGLEASGYEVVTKEDVLATPTYGILKGHDEPLVKSKRAIYAPTGMKIVKTIIGGALNHKATQTLPQISVDAGADSVLAVSANLALCQVRIKGQGQSTKVCSGPIAGTAANRVAGQYQGINVLWMHGLKSSSHMPNGRPVYTPISTSSVAKLGGGALVHAEGTVGKRRGLFSNRVETDADAFADGCFTVFDNMVVLAMAAWKDAIAKDVAKLTGQ